MGYLLLCVFVIILLLLLFFKIRNRWVYKKSTYWNDAIYDYRLKLLQDDGVYTYNQMENLFTHSNMYNIMYDYNQLLTMFWKWSLKSCIKPEHVLLFEEIVSIKKGK